MNLTALQDSAFLKSLGWSIANSLWQAAALFAAYHIIIISYKNASAKFKNNTSTAFLFLTFSWFIATFLTKLIQLKNEILVQQVSTSFIKEYISLPDQKVDFRFIDWMLNKLPYLSMAYLILLLLFSVRLINSYRNTFFIKNNGLVKPGVEWRLFTEKVSDQISIRKKVNIWFSKYVDVPATLGFFKPVILIPVASVNQLSIDQLEAIILHELSHIKRNDYLINLLISIFETILFFNPFAALLSKIIKRERENCCDDFVLQYQYDRHSYASALLSLERYRNQNLKLAITATSGKKQLLTRIKRIMEVKGKSNNFNYGQKLLALLFVTGIIASLAWLSPDKTFKKNFPGIDSRLHTSLDKEVINNIPSTIINAKNNNEHGQTKSSLKYKSLKSEIFSGADLFNDITTSVDDPVSAEAKVENEDKVLEQNTPLLKLEKKLIPSVPQGYFAGTQFLNNLPATVNTDQVRLDIAKDNASIASLDWDKINFDINLNLNKIKWPKEIQELMQNVQLDKIINSIELNQKHMEEKKFQLQKNLEALSQLHKQLDYTLMNKIKQRPAQVEEDSLFANGAQAFQFDQEFNNEPRSNFDLKEMPVRKVRIEKNTPDQHYNFTYSSSDDNSQKTWRLLPGDKKATSNKLSIEFKDGMIYINGKKVNSINKEKVETYLKSKKLVIAFDDDNKKAETEVDNN